MNFQYRMLIPLLVGLTTIPAFAESPTAKRPDSVEPIRTATTHVAMYENKFVRGPDGFFKVQRKKICDREFQSPVVDLRNKPPGWSYSIAPENSAVCYVQYQGRSVNLTAFGSIRFLLKAPIEGMPRRPAKSVDFALKVGGRLTPVPHGSLGNVTILFDDGPTELASSLRSSADCAGLADCGRKYPLTYSADFYIVDEASGWQ